MTGAPVAPIARVLGISRSSAYRETRPRSSRYERRDDRAVTSQMKSVIGTRASYGARRVRALVNRDFGTGYNLKRIGRLMEINGWKLPRSLRRRSGRAHTGLIRREISNERWCSDAMEISCWNGEYVQMAFALDCCDREAIDFVAAPRDLRATDIQQLMIGAVACRFGHGNRANSPIQWLSDNGSIYTALDTVIAAERLNLAPITTPAMSPQSNGMSEAFVNTIKRDYVAMADRSTAAAVMDQISSWIADYNAVAPHSALGFKSPDEYRKEQKNVREVAQMS